MATPDLSSTAYLVEEVVIQSCLRTCRTSNIHHYQSDGGSDWPLVSVKAAPQGDDPAEIVFEGQAAEVFTVYVVAEWPITAESNPTPPAIPERISADQLDKLSAEIRKGVLSMGSVEEDLDAFAFFHRESITEGEQDIEDGETVTDTRRVAILSFPVTVIRVSD